MLRLSGRIEPDPHLRQFCQADRQIDICERIVGQPAATIACRVHPVLSAAIVKAPVEAVRPRHARREAGIVAAPELSPCGAGNQKHRDARGGDPELHWRSLPPDAQAVRCEAVAVSPSSATANSRILNFWILPVTVVGNSSTNFQ